jgi:hypothetical protein
MVLMARDSPATTARSAHRVLRCASRACDHKPLGELRGDTLVLYRGVKRPSTHIGPVEAGMVVRVACHACGKLNLFWL